MEEFRRGEKVVQEGITKKRAFENNINNNNNNNNINSSNVIIV
jgi:hypothetical protein